MGPMPRNCVLIGAGNVAFSLAPALEKAGIEVLQVYSRSIENAEIVAALTESAVPISDLNKIDRQADLFVISVKDDAIPLILKDMGQSSSLCIHTSGSVDKGILSSFTPRFGVIYPMQTFTKGIRVDFSDIPVFVDASDSETESRLLEISRLLSQKVFIADTRQRRLIHASAVFACNFVNFMWTNSRIILQQTGNDLNILFPLIRETWDKVRQLEPFDAQTGPARRGDLSVIRSHLEILPPEQKEIYAFLSDKIMELYGYEPSRLTK